MMLAQLEYKENDLTRLVLALRSLPDTLRPTHFGEDECGKRWPLTDDANFSRCLERNSAIGFFLFTAGAVYNILIRGHKSTLTADLEFEPSLAKGFVIWVASQTRPIFAFACNEEERYYRNRVTIRQGKNKIESWVGRDTNKWIPSLYWITILSQEMIDQHHVDILTLIGCAIDYSEIALGEHMFQFYASPNEWKSHTGDIVRLSAVLPSIFDVDKIRADLEAAKNLIELNEILRKWN